MSKTVLMSCLVVVAGLAGVSSNVLAEQENAPGLPTIAKMYILNRDRTEAVPVKIQNTGDVAPVSVVGSPTVMLAPDTVIRVGATRQMWEYRQLSLGAGDNAVATLNTAGSEGWEAVAATGSANATIWTLKRPR